MHLFKHMQRKGKIAHRKRSSECGRVTELKGNDAGRVVRANPVVLKLTLQHSHLWAHSDRLLGSTPELLSQ